MCVTVSQGPCQQTLNCSDLSRVCASGRRSQAAPLTRWKECAFPTFLQSLRTAPPPRPSTTGLRWHSKHLCNQITGGQGPQSPACLHQPLLNWRSKYSGLTGMACGCYSERGGGPPLPPLICSTVSGAGWPPLLAVFSIRAQNSSSLKGIFDVGQTQSRFQGLRQLCSS